MKGRVKAVCVSEEKGEPKRPVDSAYLRVDRGIDGDAHAGPWHRQVSLLAVESIERMRQRGVDVRPGDMAENITTEGLALVDLPVGTRLAVGDEALLEVTQIGKECHRGCAVYQRTGDCVMPREGIFAKVLESGTVRPGDEIVVRPDGRGRDRRPGEPGEA